MSQPTKIYLYKQQWIIDDLLCIETIKSEFCVNQKQKKKKTIKTFKLKNKNITKTIIY